MVRPNVPTAPSKRIRPLVSTWSIFLPIFLISHQQLCACVYNAYTIYVNGVLHPRILFVVQSDSGIRGEVIDRAKTFLALAHHVSSHTPIRLMPMSIMSTSTQSALSAEMTLLLHQTVMRILKYSASSTIVPERNRTTSLKKKKHISSAHEAS